MASSFCKPLRDHSLIMPITKLHASNSKPSSLLLKDYLRDDLSSCSSSGFKSFPRRQCCTTVGMRSFLPEKDVILQRKTRNSTLPQRRRATSSSTKSTLQRASDVVINAIKSLQPLSQKKKASSTGLLSRSFSRKLLSRSFWRKATAKGEGSEGDVPRCRRSFRELLMQEQHNKQPPTSSFNEDTNHTIFTAPTITTISSGCGSNSWGESEFTFSTSAASSDNELVEAASNQHNIGVTTTGDWQNEKEQFSPVSVLEYCPFEDEEEMKCHFNSTTCSFIEGVEDKHKQKRRHYKSIASLEKRITLSELEDEPHNHSAKQSLQKMEDTNASDLLNFVKKSISPDYTLMNKAENLLFDYFKQSIGENNEVGHSKKLQLSNVAEDWVRGQPQELYLGWEVKEGRSVYISELDKCGGWKKSNQETQQMVLELETEVLTSLVNELVLDLTTY